MNDWMGRSGSAALLAAMMAQSVACSGGDPSRGQPDAGPPDGEPDAGETEELTWTGDEAAEGMAVWLDAAPAEDGSVRVTVSTRGLGEVFGLSVHLVWDPALLALGEGAGDREALPVLDPAATGQAVTLAAARDGDLALGGARSSPEAGTVTLDAEAPLAHLRFTPRAAGRTRLDLTRSVVVREGGALEALPAAGGVLVLPEVTP